MTGGTLVGSGSDARASPQEKGREVTVVGARAQPAGCHVSFPLGNLVAVTRVSGSGKSTSSTTSYTVLANKLNGARQVPGRLSRSPDSGTSTRSSTSTSRPIGRTPRSNPATYTGVFDHIRKLFATTTEAKVRGLGRFSFNVRAAAVRHALATARSRSR